jgi:hypothetical protein
LIASINWTSDTQNATRARDTLSEAMSNE